MDAGERATAAPARPAVGPADPADSPPDEEGFRLRGLEMTRIETFTDAAFAFALTLLVISLDPPASFTELGMALRDTPAFVASAALLMMFWWGHHEWSRRYGLDDGPTIIVSVFLVVTVLVYVYPLRFVAALYMTWLEGMTGLPLTGHGVEISGFDDINRSFVVYSAGFSAMCLALVLLHVHAWRKRHALRLDAVERPETLGNCGTWALVGAAGVLSLVLALLPATPPGIPGFAYMLLPVIMPLYGRWMNRTAPVAMERRD